MSKEESAHLGPPPAYDPGSYQQGPPPPGQPYPQQPPPGSYQQGPNVIVTQPTVIHTVSFREIPVIIVCPHCQAQVTTVVHFESGTFTWLIAGGICLVGGWLGCCLIPFCVDSLQDAVHTCPNCNNEVGRYNRM